MRSKIIRPNNDGQNALSKTQAEETDGKQPPDNPQGTKRTMLFDLYFFHNSSIGLNINPRNSWCFSQKIWWNKTSAVAY